MDHQTKQRQVDEHRPAPPPYDGARPVRLALVLDVVALLQRHGYRRGASRRSLASFLRTLNALVDSFEASGP